MTFSKHFSELVTGLSGVVCRSRRVVHPAVPHVDLVRRIFDSQMSYKTSYNVQNNIFQIANYSLVWWQKSISEMKIASMYRRTVSNKILDWLLTMIKYFLIQWSWVSLLLKYQLLNIFCKLFYPQLHSLSHTCFYFPIFL